MLVYLVLSLLNYQDGSQIYKIQNTRERKRVERWWLKIYMYMYEVGRRGYTRNSSNCVYSIYIFISDCKNLYMLFYFSFFISVVPQLYSVHYSTLYAPTLTPTYETPRLNYHQHCPATSPFEIHVPSQQYCYLTRSRLLQQHTLDTCGTRPGQVPSYHLPLARLRSPSRLGGDLRNLFLTN